VEEVAVLAGISVNLLYAQLPGNLLVWFDWLTAMIEQIVAWRRWSWRCLRGFYYPVRISSLIMWEFLIQYGAREFLRRMRLAIDPETVKS
jgi:hypothetical protein